MTPKADEAGIEVVDSKGADIHVETVGEDKLDLDPETAKPKYKANRQLDQAAELLAQAGPLDFSQKDKRRVLRMVDFYVCIPMCLVYWVQQMDKSTLGYGALFDLQTATHLHGQQYSLLTSIVYAAQVICQPLSAYALVVFPVKWWVLLNYTVWTVCTLCCAAATTWNGLMAARFFLGAAEATILPSFVFITQMWWTRREQAVRTVAYQIANSMAAITGPLIAWGVGHVSTTSGIHAYQAIFLAVGGVSAVFIPVVGWLLPNSPVTARFLRNGDDRLIALDRLRENNMGTKSNKWKWEQVRETFIDPKTYIWAMIYLTSSLAAAGIGNFGGLIIKGLGYSSFNATLMGMPTGVLGMVALAVSMTIMTKIKLRFPVVATLVLFPIAGASGIRVLKRTNLPGMVTCYYVAFILAAIQPNLYAWANLNQSGSTKRVVVFSIMFTSQCLGNIFGPLVWLAKEAPVYNTGLTFSISLYCALFLMILGQGWYLNHLNRKQRARREALGLPGDLKDISLMSLDEADKYKVELMEMLRAKGIENDIYANSFDDLTDWENPMFMYVL